MPFDVRREPLLAARRIATLFDEYHVRRPGMIREWETAHGRPVLAPTREDQVHEGEPTPEPLAESDRWQFELWRLVREAIGSPSPPLRALPPDALPEEALLVVGLESLSHAQLGALHSLGVRGDVDVLLVHPSPGLREARPRHGSSASTLPARRPRDPEFPPGVDPLLPVWLAGASDLDDLLAAAGVPVASAAERAPQGMSGSLLGRMQRSVAAGRVAETPSHDPAADRSFAIHRCHSLSRQAEVLHDALLRAFEEVDGLQPHEVAIVSPCIERAAPHLRAAFGRTVTGHDRGGRARRVSLPLVVADRSIRETSEAADLLKALLSLPGSRAGVDEVLAVAGHTLVREAFGIDDDDVSKHADLVERAAIRWGLDIDHRARQGLRLQRHADVHTWKLGLERMLLGATLPDAPARAELGGVVPLSSLDPEDVAPVAKLVRVLGVIRTLEAATREDLPTAAWCDAIDEAILALCGGESSRLREPFDLTRRLRAAAVGTAGERVPVPFEDVRRVLVAWMEEKSGRQQLRTGSITATSMVPLRGVPYRVVAVIGYDEGAVGTGEADGADLVGRQWLVGDIEPRIDQRRALLDCLLSAGDRLLIVCNGRSAKSNKRLPLVTALAELVDFAVRHGVSRETHDGPAAVEIDHPRHHLDRRNFEEGGVERGGVWSHDQAAAEVLAAGARSEAGERSRAAGVAAVAEPGGDAGRPDAAAVQVTPGPPVVELSSLEAMVKDPLRPYLRQTLGVDTWRDDEAPIPATLPLGAERREVKALTLDLLGELDLDSRCAERWIEAKQLGGDLPLGVHAVPAIAEIVLLASGLLAGCVRHGVRPGELLTEKLDNVRLGDRLLAGTLGGLDAPGGRLVSIHAGKAKGDSHGRPLHVAVLRLLAARAAGLDVRQVLVLGRRDDWTPGASVEPWQARTVVLADSLMQPAAAAGRLAAIVRLAEEAARSPRPAFDKVLTADPAKREASFETFVGGETFGWSSERIVFGPSPSFAEVYGAHSERLVFLDRFLELLHPTYDRSAREYRPR